ncbi:hypothetical protein K440DRAFT_646587 [Wilcoxina mikolae CBS 423.85]|nr:hypothetical protein K440DRAFT_646587 [Wilcoxina mikolae CBS 423.85]
MAGVLCGELYKQGMFLSTETIGVKTEYHVQYITSCGILNLRYSCTVNRFTQYGRALDSISNASAYSTGVSTTDTGRRVIIAGTPGIRTGEHIKRVSGSVLALVSDYWVPADAVDFIPSKGYPQHADVDDQDVVVGNASINHHWMIKVKDMKVVGDAKWCNISGVWTTSGESGGMRMIEYDFDGSRCANTTYDIWYREPYYLEEYRRIIYTDFRDRSYKPNDLHLIDSAYIFAALYSVQTFGPYGAGNFRFDILGNDTHTAGFVREELQPFNTTSDQPTIESNWIAGVYILSLVVAGVVCVYCGYVDRKVWMSVWAPVYMSYTSAKRVACIRELAFRGLMKMKSTENGKFLGEDGLYTYEPLESGVEQHSSS